MGNLQGHAGASTALCFICHIGGLRVYPRHQSVRCNACGSIYHWSLVHVPGPGEVIATGLAPARTPDPPDDRPLTLPELMRRDAEMARHVAARQEIGGTDPEELVARREKRIDAKTKKPDRGVDGPA